MEKNKNNEKIPYWEKLNKEARDRYMSKLSDINNVDPYDLRSRDWSSDTTLLPPTSSVDITNYLVFGVSAYTLEEFKAYKSLEAHGHFTNGWVQDLFTYRPQMCNNTVVTAKVMHSQRLNDTPLKPWAIIDLSGAISSAHCTCMAGIAETCTHVATLLFKLEAIVRCREKTTVTGKPAYWMIPSNISKVGAEVGHKIDFTTAKAKRKSLDQLLDGEAEHMPALRTVTSTCTGNTCTQDQWTAYLSELQKASPKAALLSCAPRFCDAFADKVEPCPAPDSLSKLRDAKMDGSDLSALRLHCRTLLKKADISDDQAHYIEMHSRLQHRSSTWYRFRTGRVTASTMHAVFRSDLDNPAVSTVKAVCGTDSGAANRCAATAWGRQNEQRGQTQYRQKMEKQHCDFELSQCGFIINPNFPQVGASPDAIVECTCCGKGCVEIKCPFKYPDSTILEACKSDKHFCLETVDGKLQLKKEHPYYKQVQTQIFVADAEYCDFVVWTLKDCVVLRVAPDPKLWRSLLKEAQQFFEHVCLPELVSHFFTRDAREASLTDMSAQVSNRPRKAAKPVSEKPNIETTDKLWCFCRGPETKDDMVACDNENCLMVWFHLSCVGLHLTTAQSDFWICPQCSN